MSILNRIATLTKAAIHEGLNKLEDPVLLTGQYLRELEEEIATAERNERDLKVAASVLERRIKEYRLLAEECENTAAGAMNQGNDEAARQSIIAKLRHAESIEECEAGLVETRQALSALEINISSAKEEHARLKAKRAELTARARQAAQTLHSDSPPNRCGYPSLNAGAAARGFDRMEEKITEWEIRAEHSGRSSAPAVYPAVNPALSSAVDSELERLRNRSNGNSK